MRIEPKKPYLTTFFYQKEFFEKKSYQTMKTPGIQRKFERKLKITRKNFETGKQEKLDDKIFLHPIIYIILDIFPTIHWDRLHKSVSMLTQL